MYIDPFAPVSDPVPASITGLVKTACETQHSPSPQLPEEVIPHSLGGFRGAFQSLAGRPPTEQEIWAAGIRSWRHLNEHSFNDLPTRVTAEHVDSLIEREEYTILTGTLVRCDLFLTNGHVVTGESRPVAQENFIHEEGKQRALAAAHNEIFKLEAYVLRKKRFEQGLV